jgi:hypothetical protein
LPEDHPDVVVLRRCLGLDAMLLPARKEQKASLSTRVLDRDHHECLDELPEIDLTGHRLQCLDYGYEVQFLDGRAY